MFKKFDDVYDLSQCICSQYYDAGCEDIAVIADYDTIREVFLNVIYLLDEVYIESIKLESPDMDGYCDPWILVIDKDGGIWCEEAVRDSGWVKFSEDVVFVSKEYESEARKYSLVDGAKFISFCVSDYECDEECQKDEPSTHFKMIKDDSGKIHGFDFEDFGDDSYFSMTYSQSGEMNVDEVIKMLNKLR